MEIVFWIAGTISLIVSLVWVIRLIRVDRFASGSSLFSSSEWESLFEESRELPPEYASLLLQSVYRVPISKTFKVVVLTLLCLANAIIITAGLFIVFGEISLVFLFIGTAAAIFDILIALITITFDRL